MYNVELGEICFWSLICIQVKMNKKVILNKLEKLRDSFQKWEIPVLHQHEVNPWLDKSSRENYLYFIMTCSLNFQRLSPNTRKSALATWQDENTRFVFFPEKVVERQEEEIRMALLKHKLALQPNKHIAIRKTISETWNTYFNNDPRNLFKQNDFDVLNILNVVQKEMKKQFPYLSWAKLSNYFLFILLEYSDLKLKNTSEISIIPDTHIMKSTKVLWIIEDKQTTPEEIAMLRKELLEDTKYSPIDFHSILRNRSRNNFIPSI